MNLMIYCDQVIFLSRPPQIAGLAKARPTALSAVPPYSTRSPYGFLLPLIVLSYNCGDIFERQVRQRRNSSEYAIFLSQSMKAYPFSEATKRIFYSKQAKTQIDKSLYKLRHTVKYILDKVIEYTCHRSICKTN